MSGCVGAAEVHVVAFGDHGVRARVVGELDIAGTPQLEEILQREISAGNDVVLDLCDLVFMDCSGLHTILAAADAARRNGGTFKIAPSMSTQVRRLIDLAQVKDRLEIIPA